MSDRTERACGKCGSLLHHEDDCGVKRKRISSSAGLAAPRPTANPLDKLVNAWNGRGRELIREGEKDQGGIYLVCAAQLKEHLHAKRS